MTTGLLRVALTTVVFLSIQTSAFASDSGYRRVFANKDATGDALVQAFFELLSQTGSPVGRLGTTDQQDQASKRLVKPFLDPAFQLQRSTGERYTADTYIPSDVDRFKLDEIRVTRPANNVIIVRYSAKVSESLPGEQLVMSENKAPRLTVFHWSKEDSRWKVLSHANFNTPIAAICNTKPVINSGLKSTASVKDQALGEGLMDSFFTLIEKGDAKPILHPFIQFQSANGVGYTTLAERQAKTQYPKPYLDKPIVTRNANLLVVSQNHTTENRVLMGKYQRRGGKSPILATFINDNEASWRMIAFASFAPAKALPADVKCKEPS